MVMAVVGVLGGFALLLQGFARLLKARASKIEAEVAQGEELAERVERALAALESQDSDDQLKEVMPSE